MELNKIRFYQLHKQNLIQKAKPDEYANLLKAHIGLHSTDYLTPYLSLWARVENFEPKLLFNDLNEPWNALRIRAFRGTIFVVHKKNLKNILGASKIFQSSTVNNFEKFLSKMGLNSATIEQKVVNLLSDKKDLTVHELKKLLDDQLTGEYFTFTLRYLEFKGVLVRTNHRYITDKVIRYGLMDEWFPEIAVDEIDSEEALQTLILNYVCKFGPVCLDDLSWWLPINKTLARKMIDKLNEQLICFDFNDREYFMEKDDYERLKDFELPDNQQPIINFIPYEDHFPKAYSIRNWFLSEAVSPLVHKKGVIYRGQIFPSIWLNGEIIGGWEMNWIDKAKSAMKVEIINIYEKLNLSKQITQLIESQRTELENFVNEKLVPLMNK